MRHWLPFVMLIFTSVNAKAHLLPKQNATVKISGSTANFVVAVPASALQNVDDNQDGLLSAQETERHKDDIGRQFKSRFTVSDRGNLGDGFMLMVMPPSTEGGHMHNDYVVILHRVKFAETPLQPKVTTDLFGTGTGEEVINMRGTSVDHRREEAFLTPANNTHEFFKQDAPVAEKLMKPEAANALSGLSLRWLMLAIFPLAAALFYFRRANQ